LTLLKRINGFIAKLILNEQNLTGPNLILSDMTMCCTQH